jgi:hypothetical protein
LGMVTDSDVKIDEMQEKDEIFEIKGEYRYRPMYQNDSAEQGTFTIALDRKLQPKNIKIIPNQKKISE